MTRACRNLLAGTLALAVGCGGGGGGGDGVPPTIVAAAFVGAGPVPVPGDTLILFFSEDVVVTGSILDDVDLLLAAGSLGTIAGPPTLVSPRSVSIVLGGGVAFTPGATTIVFQAQNDGVRDVSGVFGNGGTPVQITAGDGNVPTITGLTFNAIDPQLNGTGAAGGTLQTPLNGFTIDFTATDPSSPLDPPVITANLQVSVGGMPRTPGTDLAPDLTLTQIGNSYSYLVPGNVLFSAALNTLTVQVSDTTGMLSDPAQFRFFARSLVDSVRPFETGVNPSQVWFLDVSRDVESYAVNLANMFTPVEVTQGGNGREDLYDLFLAMGLHSATPIPDVQPGMDSNEVVSDRFRTAVLNDLGTLFAGVNINFTFTSPGAFPPQASVPYNNVGFSQICISGAEDPSGATGILGVAMFDLHNATQNDNCQLALGGVQRLGVFVHTMVNDGIGAPGASLFRITYDPFTTEHGGTPIGDMAGDAQRLLGVPSARTTQIDVAIARAARMIAVVTAHETGHSMGLVANGAMPTGLYGNKPTNFPLPNGINPGAASGHIHNSPPMFPLGTTNVMSPAIAFSAAQQIPFTRFNDLNLAYLLELVIYN